jgi:hypothetical protein
MPHLGQIRPASEVYTVRDSSLRTMVMLFYHCMRLDNGSLGISVAAGASCEELALAATHRENQGLTDRV